MSGIYDHIKLSKKEKLLYLLKVVKEVLIIVLIVTVIYIALKLA